MKDILKIFFLILLSINLLFIIKYIKFKNNNPNHSNTMNEKIIRPMVVAGSFYPQNKKELQKQINKFLDHLQSKNYKNLRALIVPHAGIIYSGQTAAYAFKQLENQKIEKVILVGPAHYEYLNKLGLSHADFWESPLGEIEIDIEKVIELEKNKEFIFADSAINQEHSLEIQLPFLQTIIKNNWQLIPIITGQVNDKEIISASKAIIDIMDDKTILIISTDLSHYHQKKEAKQIDQKCLDSIKNIEFNSECEACGEVPLKLLFQIAKQLNWESEILKYSDSGDINGDEEVVGYVSAIFKGLLKNNFQKNKYSNEEKNYLLNLARNTIKYAFQNNEKLMPVNPKNIPQKFQEKRGVFVTLNKNKKLRGCIGYIEDIEKIYLAVQKNALSAAFHDPRFSALEEKELEDCKIEISILSIPQKTKLDKIKENIDGVILKQENHQATYLPQVWQSVSGPAEFYGSLCMKAGLQADCYTDPETEFYKYQAEVFSE